MTPKPKGPAYGKNKKKIVIRGKQRSIQWPPVTDDDWEALNDFLEQQAEVIGKLRRAVVSLEKKCHWGMPTQPVLRKRPHCRCKEKGPDGEPVDILDDGDEGDGSGGGSDGQQEALGW